MKIYMLNINRALKKFPNLNRFDPSGWNDLDELPEEVISLMKSARKNDEVYTIDNFMLDFNIQDKTVDSNNYIMFIPDPKFNITI